MKFLVSSLFLFALASAAYGSSANWGARNSTDILLSRDLVVRTPVRNNQWSINVDYPRSGTTNNRVISAVYVWDNFRNNSGAQPSLWSGGPGWRFVTVNLRGILNQGVNSTVEIWGRR